MASKAGLNELKAEMDRLYGSSNESVWGDVPATGVIERVVDNNTLWTAHVKKDPIPMTATGRQPPSMERKQQGPAATSSKTSQKPKIKTPKQKWSVVKPDKNGHRSDASKAGNAFKKKQETNPAPAQVFQNVNRFAPIRKVK